MWSKSRRRAAATTATAATASGLPPAQSSRLRVRPYHDHRRLHKTLILISLFISTTSGLNISKEYDPYLRPNHGAVADSCNVSLKIMSIMDINQNNNMEFTMDFILTTAWTDPRLRNLVEKETVFMNEFPHKIWMPDVHVVNAYQSGSSSRRTFRLKPEGEVRFSERLVSRVSCPTMSFMKYPFDKYACDIKLQSFAYNVINLDMVWNGLLTQNDIQITHPEYHVHSVGQKSMKEILGDGQYSTLKAHIILRRSGIRSMTHAIIPLVVFALVSYLTLFFHTTARSTCAENVGEDAQQKSATTAIQLSPVQVQIIRLSINGLMMIMTTLISQLHFIDAPKTATVTALDVWSSVTSAIILIIFIHNLTMLITRTRIGSNIQQENEENEIKLSSRIDGWLKVGVPLFLIMFSVIFFAVCLT